MTQEFYRAFEDRYRGSRDLIKNRLCAFLPFVEPLRILEGAPHSIDLGCGRGEWLELMQQSGFTAKGVDLDAGMLLACRELGLNAVHQDAIAALRSLPDDSQTIVSGFHIAEHLPFPDLQTLMKEAHRVLRPAGLLILETPNPENLVVGATNFYLDPTHQRPLPQQLLSFLAEYHGFYRVKVLRLQEASNLSGEQAVALMDVLGGVSPDYAIVAQKSADEGLLALTQDAFNRDYGVGLDFLAAKYERQSARKFEATEARQSERDAERDERDEMQFELHERRASNLEIQIEQATRVAASNLSELEDDLSATQRSLAELEKRVQAIDARAHNTLEARLRSFVRTKVAAPLVIAAHRVVPHGAVKQRFASTLHRHFPGLHGRLQRLVRRNSERTQLSSTWEEFSGTLYDASDLHPALSDPDLLSLERPAVLAAEPQALLSKPSSEILEPVVDLSQMRHSAASVCFVVAVERGDRSALERTLQSVLRQTDPSWEVLLCSTDEHAALVTEWLDIDWRIRGITALPDSNEITKLQLAAKRATTDFLGLLAQGDVVDDDLVKMVGEKVRAISDTDVVYTDEASRTRGDRIGHEFYKPDWSPEHQYSVNMVGRFTAIRKSLYLDLESPTVSNGLAAEYELLLAATSRARKVAHIDEVLYFRADPPQPALGGFFNPESLDSAREVLERHVRKECVDAHVKEVSSKGNLQVVWPVPDTKITLVILTGMREREIPGRGKIVLVTNFIESIITKSSHRNYEILVVDDGFVPDELRSLLEKHGHSCATYPKRATFSFANKANFATSLVASGIVVLLNDDLEVISPDWIQILASQAARPSIGAVGARLLFSDNTLQHAGIGLGFHGSAGHMFHRFPVDGPEYGGFANIDRNYSAVTGAVVAYRKDVFDAVGGFDEQFPTDYNDLDFCLKCIDAGYRVVYSANAMLYHFHNSSLKRTQDSDTERAAFLDKWGAVVSHDPFFSKHFQRESHDRPPVEGMNLEH